MRTVVTTEFDHAVRSVILYSSCTR